MASEKTDALMIRLVEWSETSLIVTMLTRDFGKVSAVAKGARRPKSSFEGALDLLAVCRVVIIPKSGDTLDLLTEAKLERRFRAGCRDLNRLYAGYYVVELLRELTDDHDPSPELFDLATSTLEMIDGDTDIRGCLLRFELLMLRLLGHAPSLEVCSGCGVRISFASETTEIPSQHAAPIDSARSDLPTRSSRNDRLVKHGSVAFGLSSGGVLCTDCKTGTRGVVVIDEKSRKWMSDTLREEQIVGFPNPLPEGSFGEIRGLVSRFIADLVGGQLRLTSYLAGIKHGSDQREGTDAN